MYALYVPWRAYARLKKIPVSLVKRDLAMGQLRIASNDRGTLCVFFECVPEDNVEVCLDALIAMGCAGAVAVLITAEATTGR